MAYYYYILAALLCMPSCMGENIGRLAGISARKAGGLTSGLAKSPIVSLLESLGFADIARRDTTILIDLKYATTDNFTGKILYKELNKAYLHPVAMEKLSKASELLRQSHPGLRLLVYDAARPLSVQKEMFDAVKDTPYRAYVADPSRTGLHNYGIAVDLTICDLNGQALDMGTKFDFFGKEAGINNEDIFLSQGIFTDEQIKNRRLLRNVMLQAGFLAIRGEWWHFNACSLQDAKRISHLIE